TCTPGARNWTGNGWPRTNIAAAMATNRSTATNESRIGSFPPPAPAHAGASPFLPERSTMGERRQWTRAELDAALACTEARLAETEADYRDARPVPPMTVEECLGYGQALMDLARGRPLTRQECFLHGQLMSVLIHAATAEALGYRGRYFVIPEDLVEQALGAEEGPE